VDCERFDVLQARLLAPVKMPVASKSGGSEESMVVGWGLVE
jgi:hypothetical protein